MLSDLETPDFREEEK